MDISTKQAEEILTAYQKLYFDKPKNFQEIVDIYKRRQKNLKKLTSEE